MKYDDFIANDERFNIDNKIVLEEAKEHKLQMGSAAFEPQLASVQTETDFRPYMEPIPDRLDLRVLQNNLGHCLDIIEDEVMKGYVTRLDQLPVVMPDANIKQGIEDTHFFRISELVYQENEFSVDKLAMIFHAMSNKPCTLVLMLKSDGDLVDFYLGARPNAGFSSDTLFMMLKNSILGFFPGSRITEYYDEEMKNDMHSLGVGGISSVTCIADYKRDDVSVTDKDFIQGLEKFVYTMAGNKYTAIFIADSVENADLLNRKREYERIYTQISPFANIQLNFAVSDGGSTSTGLSNGSTLSSSMTSTTGMTKSQTDGITQTVGSTETVTTTEGDSQTDTTSETVSDGKTHTVSESDSTSRTVTDGVNVSESMGTSVHGGVHGGVSGGVGIPGVGNVGVNAGRSFGGSISQNTTVGYNHSVAKGTSHTDSISDSVSKTLTHGLSSSMGRTHSDSMAIGNNESVGVSSNIGTSFNEGVSDTISAAFNLVDTKTMTDTFGTSKSVTLNAGNKTLQLALNRIEKHLDRIEECESFGMWSFAAYFLGESAAESETAACVYKSVIAGSDSGIERSAINTWTNDKEVKHIKEYIENFYHPQFAYTGFSYDDERIISVNPSALVSTSELAIHMGLPRHSVKGLPVIEHAQFAQEVINKNKNEGQSIGIGKLYHLGQVFNSEIELDINSLSMHTFITGSTGSGKSNTIYKILSELQKKGICFLVIEPAKGEYKTVFGNMNDVSVYGTNPNISDSQLLRINPFRFPSHTHILEHLDKLVEIFNVCWPMYAAMPAILKDSVERAYVRCGWDLEKSINKYDENLFPTFNDVVNQVSIVLNESDYSNDNKGDYIGSLVTRLRSLTNGINGMILTSDDIDDSTLFDCNAIIDLSRVGSSETKSLIMGLLILKLQEYRMQQRCDGTNANENLKHITVLEEAHNLLKRTSTEQSSESSNLVGKSVEMIANSIAEMRTYGEGFVIADQSPGMLDMSAIRNTNTKIVLRLPDIGDRELVGKAAGLNDTQIVELTRLEKGVAAISQNDWLEPVLCKVDRFKNYEDTEMKSKSNSVVNPIDNDKVSKSLLDCIMNYEIYRKGSKLYLKPLRNDVLRSKLDSSVKCDFLEYLGSHGTKSIESLRKLLYEFLNADAAIKASIRCGDIKSWAHSVADHLEPKLDAYSSNQIDLVMALIIKEQFLRDISYKNIYCKFTEVHKMEGGVY